MTKAVVEGTTTTYTYAGGAQNAVLSETTGGGTTYKVVYGRADQVGNPTIAQYQVGSATAYVESDPVTGQATMLHTSTDVAALYVYDGLGSAVALLTDFNSASFQYKYDPFGLPTLQQSSGDNGVGQNPYAFKSGIQDRATGLVKFGQRWYNPGTGTWTQQDTLDSPLSALNANRYAYAGNDPVNNIDPTGTKSDPKDFASTVGAFAGGAGGVGAVIGCAVTIEIGCVEGAGVGAAIGGVGGAAFGLGYAIGEATDPNYNP